LAWRGKSCYLTGLKSDSSSRSGRIAAMAASHAHIVLATALAGLALLGLGGCAPGDGETQTYYPEKNQYGTYDPAPQGNRQGVFGGDGLAIFGGGNKKKTEEGGSGIGVNSFLWRATLDTISFMP